MMLVHRRLVARRRTYFGWPSIYLQPQTEVGLGFSATRAIRLLHREHLTDAIPDQCVSRLTVDSAL